MKKTVQKTLNQYANNIKKSEPSTPKPTMEIHEMEIEDKKEDINIDEVISEKMNGKKTKSINLDDTKKKKGEKKTYDIDDTVIRDITLTGDIHVRLISNINGYWVDLRKYFKGYPSKKGIRMLASKFAIACEYIKQDLKEVTKSVSPEK